MALLTGAIIGLKKIGGAIAGKGVVAKGAGVGLGGYGVGAGIREATEGAGTGARRFFLAGGQAVEQTGKAVERNLTGIIIIAVIIGIIMIIPRFLARK